MTQLTICRASAGSGKTYKLTEEYLKLVFKDSYNYKRILAVTFTNKATEEMKTRIVKELNKLAKGNKSDYIEMLRSEFNLSDKQIQGKALEILTNLLHDYSRFSISTIDKFFQKVLRSFVRELGINSNVSIELDSGRVLRHVIDDVFVDIDNNKNLKKWLVDFAEVKMSEGKNWNFKKDIAELGQEIFKEDFKSFSDELIEKLNDKDFLKDYIKTLKGSKKKFEDYLKAVGDRALKIIKDNGLTIDDFSRKKSGVAGHFVKLSEQKSYEPTKTAIDALDEPTKWYSKTSAKAGEIETAFSNGLNDCLREAIEYYDTNKTSYNSVNSVINFLYSLGLLTDIAEKIKEYCADNNIFLLSDAANLLNRLIGDNDSPFIYEKIGFMYKNFMIDEFQDTSKMQWLNFKPLITNSLSEGNNNLVVGDVKQSIYRWRSGDWNLLATQIEEDFKHFDVEPDVLKYNWRSKKNVINYNNSIFFYAANILQNQFNASFPDDEDKIKELYTYSNQIVNAYSSLHQLQPNEKDGDGYIKHVFVPNDENWKLNVKSKIPAIIEGLQDKGISLKDIVFLVRTKTEGKEIADFLIEYKNSEFAKDEYRYDFISSEALYLNNSPGIRLIIDLIKYFNNSEDQINRANIVSGYQQYILKNEFDTNSVHNLFDLHRDEENSFYKYLPEEFKAKEGILKKLSLFELAEELIKIFNLNLQKEYYPYLQSFLDAVMDFSSKEISDIKTFVDWWEEDGVKKSITSPEQQDAMRIMTIHASKGLEFKVVIMPFCNWELDHPSYQTNIIWCKPEVEPFNKIDLLPIKYSSKLKETIFYKEYFKEKLQTYVDNLNLLYVAFTRAEDMLFTFSKIDDKKNKTKDGDFKNVSGLLYHLYSKQEAIKNDNELIDLVENWSYDNEQFELGDLDDSKFKTKDDDTYGVIKLDDYISGKVQSKLRLKFQGEDFFNEEDKSKSRVNYGKLMHRLFENIKSLGDIDNVLTEFKFEGLISEEESVSIKSEISDLFKNETIKSWFDTDWIVKAETSILQNKGVERRPDRVLIKDNRAIIIDYKFGDKETQKHKTQVKEYASLLKQMGFTDVKAYLLYFKTKHLVNVEIE